MAKLTRVTGKVFGSQASPTGDVDNGAYIGQFGSAQAGTYVGTDDVAMIQNLPAWEQGWIGACVEEDQLPPLPERTGVDKVLSYQECYLLQQGMPEWDSATTYYIDNFCSYNGIIYKSLTDINLNNQPDTSVANWEVYGKISQYTKFAINKGNPDLFLQNASGIVYKKRNVVETGSLTWATSFASDFSTSNYLILPSGYSFSTANNFELVFKFNCSDGSGSPTIFGTSYITYGYHPLVIRVANNKISAYGYQNWVNTYLFNIIGTTTVSNNTDYMVKLEFTGSAYNLYLSSDNGNTWNLEGTSSTSNKPTVDNTFTQWSIGVLTSNNALAYPFLGIIDLANSYLKINGTSVWTGIIDGTSLDYDYTESTVTQLMFDVDNTNPLTYTNIMGETRAVDSLLPIDVSAENDGTYKVTLPQAGNQPYLFDGRIVIGEKYEYTYTNVATSANAISSASYSGQPNTYAFDGNTSTFWLTNNSGSSINNNDYIGQSGLTQKIAKIRVMQGDGYSNTDYCAHYKIQYSEDSGVTWNDIQEVTNGINNTWQEVTLQNYNVTGTYSLRLLATQYSGTSSTNWGILELQLLVQDSISIGDIWLNPQEPYSAKQFDGADWQDFNDVLLLDSSVTVGSGVITDLEQPKYNNPHITPNKSYISSLGMPSDKYIDLTLLSSGSTYVAPANGYFYLSKVTASTNQNITLANTTKNFLQDAQAYSSGITLNATIMVEKNDIVNISYSANGTTNFFRFIYAEGEV